MAYEYVKETFGKHFFVGQKVKHFKMGNGEVTPETSACTMIMVQIEGIPFSMPCDPWDLEAKDKG